MNENSAAQDFPAVDQMLCFSLYSATQAMNRVYQPLLQELGITYPQYIVLAALWQDDGQTVSGIGRRLGLESNTLTPLLKRMENSGLVKRKRSTADERQVLVTLAEDGRAMKARAAHIPRCILEATGMTPHEAGDLRDRINDLREQLAKAS